MTKDVRITFDDKDFIEIQKRKNGKSWKAFIKDLALTKQKSK